MAEPASEIKSEEPEVTFTKAAPDAQDSVNTPDISPQGKVRRKAIRDRAQAWDVYMALKNGRNDANTTNAIIWNKFNDGQPFDEQAMVETGQSHRYNFPTGFLASIVEQIVPIPLGLIDSARFLTSATLKNTKENPNAAEKTDIIREEVTRAIRQWPDWKTRCTELAQDTVLIGQGIMLRLDPYTPWCKFFRVDQAFLPQKVGQHARNVQIIAAEEDVLISDMAAKIVDREAAKEAGWKITATTNAVNSALPKQSQEDPTNPRVAEDKIRELNSSDSYTATEVHIAHLWAVEVPEKAGEKHKVSHFILNRDGTHDLLFEKENRYDSIEDVVALFTIEPGNGHFYGSRGIGRKLINQHLAIERARNRMMDQLEAAGLVILHSKAQNAPMVQFKVKHPFMLVTTEADISEETVQANVEAFVEADAKITDITQQRVGQYLPSSQVGDQGQRDKTAREVTVDYEREQKSKVAFLSRFWGQFGDLISMTQRGLLDKETEDDIALELQKRLTAKDITREDMEEFRNCPASEVVQDLTQQHNAEVIAIAADPSVNQNPNVDQKKLLRMKLTAMSNATIADELIIPEDQAQTNDIEGVRMQIFETEAIMSGSPGVPVSPRDRHEAHLKWTLPDLDKGLKALASGNPTPEQLGKIANGIEHADAHVKEMEKQGEPPEKIKQYQDAVNQLDQILNAVTRKSAQQHMDAKAAGAQGPPGAPTAAGGPGVPPGAPPGGAPEPQGPSMDPVAREAVDKSYKEPPPSIKRQIELSAGYVPATPEEEAAVAQQKMLEKHPTAPDKMAAASSMATQPNLPEDVAAPTPEGSAPPEPPPESETGPPAGTELAPPEGPPA